MGLAVCCDASNLAHNRCPVVDAMHRRRWDVRIRPSKMTSIRDDCFFHQKLGINGTTRPDSKPAVAKGILTLMILSMRLSSLRGVERGRFDGV